MKNIAVLLCSILLIACHTNHLLKEAESVISANQDVSLGLSLGGHFDLTDRIFDCIENRVGNDCVYIFGWVPHWGGSSERDFVAIVFDRQNDSTYYLSNTIDEPYRIIVETAYREDFEDESFILHKYLGNNIQDVWNLTLRRGGELGMNFYLVDIKKKITYFFEGFVPQYFWNPIILDTTRALHK